MNQPITPAPMENEFLRFVIRFGWLGLLALVLWLGSQHYTLKGEVQVLQTQLQGIDAMRAEMTRLEERYNDSNTAIKRLDDRTLKINDLQLETSNAAAVAERMHLALDDARTNIRLLEGRESADQISIGRLDVSFNSAIGRIVKAEGEIAQLERDVHSICERAARLEGKALPP